MADIPKEIQKKFNRESGLDEETFVEFIKTSQPKKWEKICENLCGEFRETDY